jgi:GNAT superfamily N-acetyltransferase
MSDAALQVLPLEDRHRAAWDRLYASYAAFYGVNQTDEMRDRVWGWLTDASHEVKGFIAELNGSPVGITHYRPYARPLFAGTGGFLDDLFVDPAARGNGVAEALIAAVAAVGREKGWGLIRWITNDTNYRGRAVYDRVATLTPWRTYDIKL